MVSVYLSCGDITGRKVSRNVETFQLHEHAATLHIHGFYFNSKSEGHGSSSCKGKGSTNSSDSSDLI